MSAGAGLNPDGYGGGFWFKVTLDGDPMKEESNFRECTGLNVFIDQTELYEGGRNDAPHKRPGPARYENIVLRRGVSASKSMWQWIANAVNRQITRMSGKITLMNGPNSPVMEWTFERGWPCRYEGPKFDAANMNLELEAVEIAHEGLKLQPGGGATAPTQA
jgi:phage tail-like protein